MLLWDGKFFGQPGGGAGVDPDFANVVLLSGFEGTDGSTTLDDESSYNNTMTVTGNAQIDTAQSKFGASSLLLDGTGDWVTVADRDEFSFGTGAFTIEAFVRRVNTNAFVVVSKYNSDPTLAEWVFQYSSGDLQFVGFYSTSSFFLVSGTVSLATGTWHHVMVDRTGDDFRLYANGSMVGSATEARNIKNTGRPLRIGSRDHGTPNSLNGWLDELRITKGVARCGSDGGYTVPTAAFPRS